MFTREDLLSKMHVKEIDTCLYQGEALQMGLKRVFGGQVLGQALNAAMRTVDPERRPHSLHAYFLRPGDTSRSILYEVDPIRDGRSFSTRRVVAKQRGKPIFNASISFQKSEQGVEHQMDLPRSVPDPDVLQNDSLAIKELLKKTQGPDAKNRGSWQLTFDKDVIDIRTPELSRIIEPGHYAPEYGFWFKFNADMGDNPIIHQTLLAFISDKGLIMTGLLPHNLNFQTHDIIMASLDHAMWFHSEFRVDEWIYYHIDSPRSGGARDLGRGSFYTREGKLIASTAQEGLIRIVEAAKT